jgi:hypothetical protein
MTSLTNISGLGLPPLQELQLVDTVIDGKVYSVQPDSTSKEVADKFTQDLQVFLDVFNLTSPTAEQDILNGTYHTQIQNAIADFYDIAKNGVPSATDPTKKNVLSKEMANVLDQLIRTLRAAGIQPNGTITAQDVANWKSLSATSPVIADVLSMATKVSSQSNRNLQALTELVYVKTGNEVMEDALIDLEDALNQTKAALDQLNSLQQLHNEITVQSKGTLQQAFKSATGVNISGVITGDDSVLNGGSRDSEIKSFKSLFTPFSQDFFGTDIVPIANASLTSARVADFLATAQKLESIVIMLRKINGIGSTQDFEANTLGDNLQKVLDGIKEAQRLSTTAKSALVLWILDNYNTASTMKVDVTIATSVNSNGSTVNFDPPRASTTNIPIIKLGSSSPYSPGQMQQAITNAITAAESLNDSQKEEVRRFLFVFEEYYKSASAILTKISQFIEKMAQGIAR